MYSLVSCFLQDSLKSTSFNIIYGEWYDEQAYKTRCLRLFRAAKGDRQPFCAEYELIKRTTVGRSCGGRDITALKIGSAAEYSLIAAAFHGSEHITSAVLLMFIEELADAVKNGGYIAGLNAARALNGRGVIFVPCVNPDGCEISISGINACGELGDTVRRL